MDKIVQISTILSVEPGPGGWAVLAQCGELVSLITVVPSKMRALKIKRDMEVVLAAYGKEEV